MSQNPQSVTKRKLKQKQFADSSPMKGMKMPETSVDIRLTNVGNLPTRGDLKKKGKKRARQ